MYKFFKSLSIACMLIVFGFGIAACNFEIEFDNATPTVYVNEQPTPIVATVIVEKVVEVTPVPAIGKQFRVTAHVLTVRTGCSESYRESQYLPADSIVTLISDPGLREPVCTGGWVVVSTENGVMGCACSDYLQEIE